MRLECGEIFFASSIIRTIDTRLGICPIIELFSLCLQFERLQLRSLAFMRMLYTTYSEYEYEYDVQYVQYPVQYKLSAPGYSTYVHTYYWTVSHGVF